MEVGKDLNIESLQDKETYDEKNNSSGFNFSVDVAQPKGKPATYENGGITGGKNKGNTNSNYESVTDQAGIYAGEGGFDIEVGKNTDLKGAVIASEADASKNKLSTDTLTYSDIENKAEYEASSSGVAYDSRKYDKNDPNYKNQGATPVVGTSSNGEADSTTKAAIADGTIEIRSNPQQNIANLSRDTENALNALDKIFDKKTVQEQQELAQLFGEVANNEIHRISKELGWDDGSTYKFLLHAAIAGTTAKLGGSDFKSGAISGAVNEIFINEIAKLGDPVLMQWASYILGKTVAKLTHGNVQTGGSVAASATKNNELSGIIDKRELTEAQIQMYEKMQAELEESKTEITDFMREYENLANWLYADPKAAATAGAYASEYGMNTEIASMLLNQALYGNGKSMHFDFDGIVSEDLSNSAILRNGIKKAASGLNCGETRYVYASLNYNGLDEERNEPTLDQKLAYGNVKVAVQFTRDANNNITFYGQAGDAYNFEYHNYIDSVENVSDTGVKDMLKAGVITIINNAAVGYQNIGAMQPFTWTADIQGTI